MKGFIGASVLHNLFVGKQVYLKKKELIYVVKDDGNVVTDDYQIPFPQAGNWSK